MFVDQYANHANAADAKSRAADFPRSATANCPFVLTKKQKKIK